MKTKKREPKIGLAELGWFVSDDKSLDYLHSDGKWRCGTHGPNGYTGYYKTKRAAQAELTKWNFWEGWDAFHSQHPRSACPHAWWTTDWEFWIEGWDSAKEEDGQRT